MHMYVVFYKLKKDLRSLRNVTLKDDKDFGPLVGCRLRGPTESDTTEVT